MGTTKGTAHEIAARCKRLPGWTVTTPRSHSGAYKIKAPNAMVTQVHLTPSDTNWEHSVWRSLRAAGFEEDEAKWEAQRARDKAAALEAQRRDAAKKTAELANRSAAVQKAAGPYATPQVMPWDWYTKQHPAPQHQWALIDPELAGRLINEINTDNRPRRQRTVDHYKAVILSGQWHLTHQGMAIDQRGILQDGQHRLAAIHEAGVTVPVSFYVGMPVENFKAIDEGLLRRAADLVAKDSEGYAALTAAVVKVVDAWDSSDPRKSYHQKQTNETVYDLFKQDSDNIRQAVRYGSANYKKPKMNSTGLAAAYYLIRKANGPDNAYVEAFFNGLVTGLKGSTRTVLDEDDPRNKLREQMANHREKGKRVNALDNLGLIVMAWNFVVENYRPRFLRLAENMAMPSIAKCAPTGRWASAIPDCLSLEVTFAQRQIDETAEPAPVEQQAA